MGNTAEDRQIIEEKRLKNKWAKKKRRTIKNMKKLRIGAPICALIAFAILFTTASVIIIQLVVDLATTMGLGNGYLNSSKLADSIISGAQNSSQPDYAALFAQADPGDGSFSAAVVDKEDHILLSTGPHLFDTQRLNYYLDHFGEMTTADNDENSDTGSGKISPHIYTVIIDDVYDTIRYYPDNEDINNMNSFVDDMFRVLNEDVFGSLPKLLMSKDHNPDAVMTLLDSCVREEGIWFVFPIDSTSDRLLIYSDVAMYTKRDLMNIWLIIGFAVMSATVPVLFYIITSIRNIISWHRLLTLYYMDTVTLGHNRDHFFEHSARLLKNSRKSQKQFAMVCLHLDKYQNYCTCYGAKDGEWLLWTIYQIIKSQKQGKEYFARTSGGEFGLILRLYGREQLEQRIMAIQSLLREHIPNRTVKFSTGIYEIADKTMPAEEAYNCACVAREGMRELNERHIMWYDEKMKNERLWEHHVEQRMQEALDNHEFQVYVQPKHDPVNGEMIGGEALIRWISPVDGFITPAKFIPIFEKNDFIIQIDNFMIAELSRLQGQWISEGKVPVPVSVNVSRKHFADPKLAELICRLVDRYHVPHELIEIEITESAFFEDKSALLSTVKRLKELGFELSMDDFGTGYSSMNSLKELPLDVLKLDAEFFRGENNSERGDIVVSDAITLAKHLNMRIVAEGVEHKEQVEFLADRNCDMIQGYYFAKPMPAADFAARLKTAAKPEAPAEPEAPVAPVAPAEPVVTAEPEAPVAPVAPAEPVVTAEPAIPAEPVVPAAPESNTEKEVPQE